MFDLNLRAAGSSWINKIKDCSLTSYLNVELNVVDLQMYKCMICCYVMQVSEGFFSILCPKALSMTVV